MLCILSEGTGSSEIPLKNRQVSKISKNFSRLTSRSTEKTLKTSVFILPIGQDRRFIATMGSQKSYFYCQKHSLHKEDKTLKL